MNILIVQIFSQVFFNIFSSDNINIHKLDFFKIIIIFAKTLLLMSKAVEHGGKRKGSGRKPAEDPKVQLCIYPQKSLIEAVGGADNAKAIALNAIIKDAKKKPNK